MSFVLVRTDTLEALPIGTDAVFVGSAEWKVDLCLAGDGVDDVHCELAGDPHGIRVESLSPDGVQVNGQEIQSALLFADDQLVIGPFEFRAERARTDLSRLVRQLPATLHAGISIDVEQSEDQFEAQPSPAEFPKDPERAFLPASSNHNSLWMVRRGEVEFGPMEWSEIDSMLARDELNSSDFACRERERDWYQIETLGGSPTRPSAFPASTNPAATQRSSHSAERQNQPRQSVQPDASEATAAHADSHDTSVDSRSGYLQGLPVPGPTPESAPRPATTAEPQYFIQSRSGEEGPLPRHAVQELVRQGELSTDTPVRLDWNDRWSNAANLGFAYPDGSLQSINDNDIPIEEQKPSPARGDALLSSSASWTLMAPVNHTRSLVYSLRSLPLKYLVLLLLVCGAAGFAAQRWMNGSNRTALTGTVMLDEQPLGDVVVTFNGMKSGEVAAGVADDSGRFQVLTISGKLTPGPYRITVQPKAGPGVTVPHGDRRQVVPERFTLLATSDATIDVIAGQTDYAVPLSRIPGSSVRSTRQEHASNN